MATSKRSPDRAARTRAPAAKRGGAGGTLLGVFIGLALGLALAAGVAWTLMSGRAAPPPKAAEAPAVPRDAKGAKAGAPEKDRFDFYKILPGGEEPKLNAGKAPDRSASPAPKSGEPARAPDRPADKVAAAEPSTAKAAKPGERFWLQAGSFAQESEAENLKARLALTGLEAQVQAATLQDKSVRYRVRLGPFDNPDELARVKAELARRGYDAATIRN